MKPEEKTDQTAQANTEEIIMDYFDSCNSPKNVKQEARVKGFTRIMTGLLCIILTVAGAFQFIRKMEWIRRK